MSANVRHNKAPFPWFGGKSNAAPLVWSLLGDVCHYVEPFAGSLGVLLERPHPCNRSYFSETVNDADGLLVNAWRAIQLRPEETAQAVSWPVTEADKIARQLACQRWLRDRDLEHLMGDPLFCDPTVAGWWLYGVCCQIGAIKGPWFADPVTGRIQKRHPKSGKHTEGVSRNRPHLTNNGQGVNHPATRQPGVTDTDGVRRNIPQLGSNGSGVNRPQLRQPGVSQDQPDPDTESWSPEQQFHPVTMPELVRWFQWLAARLRHVRIVNGDWSRVCTTGAAKTIPVRQKQGVAGFLLDPPYANEERSSDLYTHDCGDVAALCRQWCITNGHDPDYRIVLAGFDTEHRELLNHCWTEHEWFTTGFLTGGYGNQSKNGPKHQQHRERLWASPHCITHQPSLFDSLTD